MLVGRSQYVFLLKIDVTIFSTGGKSALAVSIFTYTLLILLPVLMRSLFGYRQGLGQAQIRVTIRFELRQALGYRAKVRVRVRVVLGQVTVRGQVRATLWLRLGLCYIRLRLRVRLGLGLGFRYHQLGHGYVRVRVRVTLSSYHTQSSTLLQDNTKISHVATPNF